jgi:trimeric autotransporter adhesin
MRSEKLSQSSVKSFNFLRRKESLIMTTMVAMLLLITSGQLWGQLNTLDYAGLSSSSPAKVAYSLRRLSSTYTGHLIQVRRSTDNTTSNIGYNGSGNIDLSALSTFVGSGDGFITIWYDQSGNGNHAIQASPTLQPKIVNAGSVVTSNSRPTIQFDGTTFIDGGTVGYGISGDRTLNVAFHHVSGAMWNVIDRNVAGTPVYGIAGDNQIQVRNNAGTIINGGTSLSLPIKSATTLRWDATNALLSYRNGTPDFAGSLAQPSTMDIMRIGRHFNDVLGAAVLNIWEVVLFPSALGASDRLSLECGQVSYYSLIPVGVAAASPTICIGSSTALTASGAGTYTWSPASGLSATTGADVTASPTVTTIYTVTGTTGSCSNTSTVTVTVNPLPVISVSTAPTSTICIGGNTTLTASGAGTYVWAPASTLSSSAGTSVVASPTVALTYTVSGTDGNGCVNTAISAILVSPLPTVVSTTGNTVCSGGNSTLSAVPSTSSYVSWHSLITGGSFLGYGNTLPITGAPSSTTDYFAETRTLTGSSALATLFAGTSTYRSIGFTLGVSNPVAINSVDMKVGSGATSVAVYYRTTNLTSSNIQNSSGWIFVANVAVNPASTPGTVNLPLPSPLVLTPGTYSLYFYTTSGVYYSSLGPGPGTVQASNSDLSINRGIGTFGLFSSTVFQTLTPNCRINYSAVTGCASSPRTVATLTVNPLPGLSVSASTSICSGSSTLLSVSGTAVSYSWSPSSGLSATTGTSITASPTITTTYTVTGTNSLSCTNKGTVTVSVNPLATPGTISGTAIICEGATTTLFASGTAGGVWTSSNAAAATVDASTGVVTGAGSGTSTISYTVTNGCGAVAATSVVSVNGLPGSITGTFVICQATTTTLGNSVSGGTWSSSNTGVATIDASTGLVSGVGAGTTIISYVTVCGTPTVQTITIDPIPAAITGTGTICIGGITTFSNSVPGGTWSSGTPSVATVDGGGVVTGLSAGNSDISYVMGCASVKRIVTVNGAPTVPAVAGMSGVCEGASISLTNAMPDGTWSSSNTTVAIVGSTGIVTGLSGGTAAISYIVSTSCGTGFSVKIVSVYSLPGPIAGTASVCEGSTTTLSTTPGGGTWSSSTVAASINPTTGVATGDNEGTTIISYQAPTGCYRTIELTVNATPGIIVGSAEVCEGTTSTLSAPPSGGTWSSSFPGKATIDIITGVVTGVTAGTTTISYNLPFGCRATTIVTVNTTPAAITGSLTVCGGSTSALSSATTGGTWSSSDAAVATINASSGVVSGISAGTTTISYTTGSCATAVVVTVSGTMTSSTGTALVCAGQAATLSNATSGGTWSSSNTVAATVHAASGLVTGVGAGTANITYTLSGGCYSITEVTVNAALGSISGSTSVCVGSTTTLSHADAGGVWSSSNVTRATIDAGTGVLTGLSGGSATISYALSAGCVRTVNIMVYGLPNTIGGTGSAMCIGGVRYFSCTPGGGTWSSSVTGVATVNTTGVVSGVAAGTTVISYTLSTGCASTRTVTVLASPSAITGSASVCIGVTTTLSSSPAGGTWTSSAPSKATVVAATGVVTGLSAGTSVIYYTVSTGCSRARTVTVVTLPAPITGTLSLCSSCATNLSSSTTSGVWTSDNLAVATVNSTTGVVSGVSVGTSTISYTATSGCARTAIVTVGVDPAAITGTGEVCVGQTNATLSHSVSGGTWSSSNTGVATVHATSGIFTGTGAGTANITYTTSPGFYTISVVTVAPAVASITGNVGICPGATMALSSTTSSGVWGSTNTAIATVNAGTGVVTAVTAGTTTVSYTISVGCYRAVTVTVNVVPNILGSATVVNGSVTTLIGSPAGGTWSSANAAIASVSGTGVVTGNSIAATTITYTLPAIGCFGTRGINVVAARPGSPLGGEVAQANVLKVYPNPTSGTLTIDAPVAGIFTVYAIDGKQVTEYDVTASANMMTLPSNLTAGLYMCRFVGADGSSAIVRLVFEQ